MVVPLRIAGGAIGGDDDTDRIALRCMKGDRPAAGQGFVIGMRGQDQD
jgi:hypothetical protein